MVHLATNLLYTYIEVFLKGVSGKCEQILKFLWFCSYLVKKSFKENVFFYPAFFLCHLKTSENLWFSNTFREYRKRAVASNSVSVIRP